jgi:prepilin-type N-terminal cleavage/methylation domain-containing protein/prepilin-type processing-associated H-X9-DG protein
MESPTRRILGSSTSANRDHTTAAAFTLIELLVVVGIISLLISILMPSLGRARDQAKGVHCLARLRDYATALAAYENVNDDLMPPCAWKPRPDENDVVYGWTEPLFEYVWKERVYRPADPVQESFPVQRNVHPGRYEKYFLCKASRMTGVSSGHYRVYLPAWVMGSYSLDANERYDLDKTILNPWLASSRAAIKPRMPIIGDANEQSERVDTSFIDAGEANAAGTAGYNGNRFSDRHYGGTNYLFQDFHGEWRRNNFRSTLATDVDLNGVHDVDIAP